jgi:hypothetical protein
MKTLRNVALVLALAGAAVPAHASVKASAVNSTDFYKDYPADVFVPLNDAGATTLSFKLSSPSKKVLTYSAYCTVYGVEGGGGWLDLDIYVNGVVVAPTIGSSDIFCSQNGGWSRASITVPIQGISGDNTIRIKARLNGSSYVGLWLGESALVIYD